MLTSSSTPSEPLCERACTNTCNSVVQSYLPVWSSLFLLQFQWTHVLRPVVSTTNWTKKSSFLINRPRYFDFFASSRCAVPPAHTSLIVYGICHCILTNGPVNYLALKLSLNRVLIYRYCRVKTWSKLGNLNNTFLWFFSIHGLKK